MSRPGHPEKAAQQQRPSVIRPASRWHSVAKRRGNRIPHGAVQLPSALHTLCICIIPYMFCSSCSRWEGAPLISVESPIKQRKKVRDRVSFNEQTLSWEGTAVLHVACLNCGATDMTSYNFLYGMGFWCNIEIHWPNQ